MEPTEKQIKVERTAQYYTMGNDIKAASHIWYIFHGYGQLASRIIRKFDQLDLDEHFVIAPEGLSKFYFSRNPTVMGASWMTSHQRLSEIEDYLKYLDQVYCKIKAQMYDGQKLNVLGFSQGSSTMWRWIAHHRPALHAIIVWAGEYPPDVDYHSISAYLADIQHKYYCLGDKDEFITDQMYDKQKRFATDHHLDFDLKKFSGKHKIDRTVLAEVVAQL